VLIYEHDMVFSAIILIPLKILTAFLKICYILLDEHRGKLKRITVLFYSPGYRKVGIFFLGGSCNTGLMNESPRSYKTSGIFYSLTTKLYYQ